MSESGQITRVCDLCGATFHDVAGRRGAPRQYCSAECKDLASDLSRIETRVNVVANRNDTSLARLAAVRGRLWRIANLLNARGVPRRDPTRPPSRKRRDGWRGLRGEP